VLTTATATTATTLLLFSLSYLPFQLRVSVGLAFAADVTGDPVLSDASSGSSAETRLDGAMGFLPVGKDVAVIVRSSRPKKPM
jgi:hypothetical protein